MKKRWNTYFKRAAVAGLSLCVLANSQLNVLATEVAGKAEEGIQSYGFWEDLFGKPEDEIETIDYIEVYREHLPVAVVGESFTDTDITLELYEDATYTAVGRWEDENGNRSGVFESQKKYYFRYVITAFEGYCFDPEIEYDIGYEDYINGEGVCIIEWANLIEDILPDEYLHIELRYKDMSREMILNPVGEKYEKIVEELTK